MTQAKASETKNTEVKDELTVEKLIMIFPRFIFLLENFKKFKLLISKKTLKRKVE